MPELKLVFDHEPTGDQPQAIEKLIENFGKLKNLETFEIA